MKATRCFFCNKPDLCCYERRKDGTRRDAPYFPACEKCARKPYPEKPK